MQEENRTWQFAQPQGQITLFYDYLHSCKAYRPFQFIRVKVTENVEHTVAKSCPFAAFKKSINK